MQCTPEQIEEKKRIAKERLARKISSPVKQGVSNLPENMPNFASSTSPRFKFNKRNDQEVRKLSTAFNHATKPYERPSTINQINQNKFYGKEKPVTLKISLIREDTFVTEMSDFFSPAIDIFKTIPSKNYNVKTRNWDFNIKDYDQLLSKLLSLKPKLILEPLPVFVLNVIKRKNPPCNLDLNRVDAELASALMSFQVEGLRFGVEKNGRCLIADDMGLGKTFQALAIAHYYKDDWPLLIVTTATMTSVWEETIHKYLPSVSIMHTQYMVSGKDYIGESKILIVSHDMMSRAIDKLVDKNFGALIIDESHVLKNFKAKCYKSASQLAKIARRVILLSGTPALSRPSELFTQLSLINDRFFGNFHVYSIRYCDGKKTNFGWDHTGKSNLLELEIVLQKAFMIRRTKEDVLKSLPNKKQEAVKLDVNLKQFSEDDRKCLNALALKYNQTSKKLEKHALLLTFFSETAKIKIPSVCSYVLQMLENKQKFLVFAHHQIMLNAIESVLKKKNVKHIRIDGNTTNDQRKFFVDKFQLDDKYMVALLSITAANAGITLTAAQLVLFAELHWNPSILSQAESRAHRIGQESTVIVRYLLAQGTADDSIWQLLQDKQKILSEIGLSKDSYEDVSMKAQETAKEALTDDLNISCITAMNTLDITTYFKTDNNANKSFSEKHTNDLLDDGMDDMFCDIDV